MSNAKNRRDCDRVGALTALRGSCACHNMVRPCPPDICCGGHNRPRPPHWPDDCRPDHRPDCRPDCRPCGCCDPNRPGGAVHATTDCPDCETCAGWPLFYTGPCGPRSAQSDCKGACPPWMRYFPASAELIATGPMHVSEDGNIRFSIRNGDADMLRIQDGHIRLVYPGRYLVSYTAQIPAGTEIHTRLAVTLDNERIFASEVAIEGCAAHTRSYTANALIEADRHDAIALEATNGFSIGPGAHNLPVFTMIITRIG